LGSPAQSVDYLVTRSHRLGDESKSATLMNVINER
jgi:hypothetical protein